FWYLITYPNFQTYYMNSAIVTVLTVVVSMVISVLAAFSLSDGVLGQPDLVDRRVPHLPRAAVPAVHPAVQDYRHDRADQQFLVPGHPVSDACGAVLHVDHDRLFHLHPEGTG